MSPLFRIALATVLCVVSARKCPQATRGFKSDAGGASATYTIVNDASVPVDARWVDTSGNVAEDGHVISPGGSSGIQSFEGHGFHIFSLEDGTLLSEVKVPQGKRSKTVVSNCDGLKTTSQRRPEKLTNLPRAAEFEALVHDQYAPCLPEGESHKWSCINRLTKEEVAARPTDGSVYGFSTKAEAGHRKIGATVDTGYTQHIPRIPRLTTGPGYLKMTFTDTLKNILLPFYNDTKKGGIKDAVEIHSPIPGGYTNSHEIGLSKIDLDRFRHIQRSVANEMKDILEWWTQRRLVHTSTFGIRIYHRDSMLINHVDRSDTHLASAVIQIAQNVDEDGGWPLEVMDAEGNVSEVYMQGAELVLYEGARFRHGRPMRLKGEDFANIFSHFAPLDWHGPNKSPNYDGHLSEDGFLRSQLEEMGLQDPSFEGLKAARELKGEL